MPKGKIFLIFCIAFVVGIFFGRFINYQIMAISAMIFIILGTVWFHHGTITILSLAGVIALFGAIRFQTEYAKNDIAIFYNQSPQITGIVVTEPDVREDKINLTLGHVQVNGQPIESKVLVSVRKYRDFVYGEKIRFTAKVQEPKEYPDFSYKNYLSIYGIDAVVYMPALELFPHNYGNRFELMILRAKNKFISVLSQLFPEPQNAFLAGLLLGAKRSIPQNLIDEFNATGTLHIIAVSGYNISIIAVGIEWLLQWFGIRKRMAFLVSAFAIMGFVIMTGATASVVRAGIMGVLLLLAFNVGRVTVAANSIAFTAAVMLAVNPQILAFDIGFQLSFGAILGIIYFSPVLEPLLVLVPKSVRQYLLATLSAQIFTVPILLYNFGSLSLIALLPNLLVLPIIPITMLFGFISGILGLLWLKLALPFAYLTKLWLDYILGIIHFFSRVPLAAISWQINFATVIGYYLLIFAILLWHYQFRSLQKGEILVNLPHHETQ